MNAQSLLKLMFVTINLSLAVFLDSHISWAQSARLFILDGNVQCTPGRAETSNEEGQIYTPLYAGDVVNVLTGLAVIEYDRIIRPNDCIDQPLGNMGAVILGSGRTHVVQSFLLVECGGTSDPQKVHQAFAQARRGNEEKITFIAGSNFIKPDGFGVLKGEFDQILIQNGLRKKTSVPSNITTKIIALDLSPSFRFRSTPTTLSVDQAKAMLVEKGFFDTYINKSGKGIKHQYRSVASQGQALVIDDATGLTWQQGGPSFSMGFSGAQEYIQKLNRESHAGFSNWRLPTLEEAMSLVEPEKKNGNMYIDPAFDTTRPWIWTVDREPAGGAWLALFDNGSCQIVDLFGGRYVRAVRSEQ